MTTPRNPATTDFAVEGHEDHHAEDEGDGGPLAVPAGVPIHGLRAHALGELGVLA